MDSRGSYRSSNWPSLSSPSSTSVLAVGVGAIGAGFLGGLALLPFLGRLAVRPGGVVCGCCAPKEPAPGGCAGGALDAGAGTKWG